MQQTDNRKEVVFASRAVALSRAETKLENKYFLHKRRGFTRICRTPLQQRRPVRPWCRLFLICRLENDFYK